MSEHRGVSRVIPVLLLKTKSHPIDTYNEILAKESDFTGDEKNDNRRSLPRFQPIFIPVLEHSPVTTAVSDLERKLEDGQLKREYGGMIFTSQRAVEAWAEVVRRVISRQSQRRASMIASSLSSKADDCDPFSNLEDLTDFPLYVVGPATERILQALRDGISNQNVGSYYNQFTRLRTSIHGAETGNGANLAALILKHYNQLYAQHWFNYFEAPRLPFIPLLGMSSENYGRKRLDANDTRLQKKPLLFLVGETRRDIIPKTLHNQTDAKRIEVQEVEVYRTEVMKAFDRHFEEVAADIGTRFPDGIAIVVVFSPQGSEIMLKNIGYLDENGTPTPRAQARAWMNKTGSGDQVQWILVSIGPTTRDYMRDNFGIDPDVCAEKPNAESLRNSIESFLQENKIPQRKSLWRSRPSSRDS